ncbi:hypothetical protein FRC02_000454 [Tulasnella sp. 418]|nr:hypothetical protein FRC02_000454 [Tulasnella sp. 418]
MTSLRSFQSEIQAISKRHRLPSTQLHGDGESRAHEISAAEDMPATGKEVPSKEDLPDSFDEQLTMLPQLLMDGSQLSNAQDILATLLLRSKGELVLRLGRHPPPEQLWNNNSEENDDWTGIVMTPDQLTESIDRLNSIANEVGSYNCTVFESSSPPRSIHLLRLPPASVESLIEVRCAVVGNVDSGKSTTLGVLTRGSLDDGRGKVRVNLFRHKHEIESGRTSSVGMEILGFSADGLPVVASFHAGTVEANSNQDKLAFAAPTAKREKMAWDEISGQSAKVVGFVDLAGHEKYLKTSLFGLTSGAPDFVLLIVGANAGMIGMSKEHLAIALALSVPVVVAITKVDMTPTNVLEETKKQVVKIMKSPGCRKLPVFVQNMETAVRISQSFTRERICPIFLLSNVTGEGLNTIRNFLNLVPSSEGDQLKYPVDEPLEYSITECWSVPHVGTVVNGLIASGRVKAGDPILFGPDSNGAFQSTVVKSIQRKRANVTSAEAGQCVSLALKRIRRAAVRKGMVIVAKTDNPPRAVRRFEGQVLILYHNSTLQRGYQAMLHAGAVRQTVRIVSMDNPNGVLRTGDRATVEFEFMSSPEFLKPGMKLLFREGKTKGLGVVTRIIP